MLQLVNTTPFVAETLLLPDPEGVDTLFVVVKATFSIQGGSPSVAELQRPVQKTDQAWGEPGRSSLRYASEVHTQKPSTDVVLVGEAWSPGGKLVTELPVGVRVGPVQKAMYVIGDRVWQGGVVAPKISKPEPFSRMPLVYERAFGGVCATGGEPLVEPRNPVGVGLSPRSAIEGKRLPNLEDPAQLIARPEDRPAPVCAGFVAASWEPRRSRAGTYDGAWARERAPYLPADFDPRFLAMASPGLVSDGYLRGGEPVEIVNASPDGLLRFALPSCVFDVSVAFARTVEAVPLALETVLIEPNDRALSLTFRGGLRCDKRALAAEEIAVALVDLTLGGRRS